MHELKPVFDRYRANIAASSHNLMMKVSDFINESIDPYLSKKLTGFHIEDIASFMK